MKWITTARLLLLTTVAFGQEVVSPAREQVQTPQIEARQSPCVFETVFPLGDPARWKRVKSMEGFAGGTPLGLTAWPPVLNRETSIPEWYDLGRIICDGVSLREEVKSKGTVWEEPGLRLQQVRRAPTGKLEVTLEATLYNPKGNADRLVTLDYEVLGADGELLQTAHREYKLVAMAKSGENADVILLLEPADVARVASLRLTLTTRPY